MLALLQFIFLDMWHFFGTLLLLGVVFDGLVSVVRAARGEPTRSVGGHLRATVSRRDV